MKEELDAGTSFARYRVQELVGRGGMGVVYRALDLRLRRSVALKVIAPEWSADERFRARFEREARSAAAIEHPHIVPVYETGEHEGRLYLAMRYLGGGDLRSLVQALGGLPPARVLTIAAQLGSALDAAHRGGIVHRDVKPANALLAGDGDTDHVYLADFGIARPATAATLVTAEGGVAGSLAYLAPEVLEGAAAGPAADRYALACTIYELLCGVPPFVTGTDAALIMAHLHRLPAAASSLAPGLDRRVDDALQWGLAKDPADRPASCAALVDALTPRDGRGRRPRVASAAATATRPPSRAGRPGRRGRSGEPGRPGLGPLRARVRSLRRGRGAAVVGTVAVLACLAGGAVLGASIAPAEHPQTGLRLRTASSSVLLPGWRATPTPSRDGSSLERFAVRSARSPAGVVATIGRLASRAEPPALQPDGAGARLLRVGAAQVRERTRRDDAGGVIVLETRATTGPTLAVQCRGATASVVMDGCRYVAERLEPAGGETLPAGAQGAFIRAVGAALLRADGSAVDRLRLASQDAGPRRGAATRLAAATRGGAAGLDALDTTASRRRFAGRLAAALETRAVALDGVARAAGAAGAAQTVRPDSQRSAARALGDAQSRLDALVRGATGAA